MINIYKKIVLFFVLLLACVSVHGATPGTSCSAPIPLGKNYSASISANKTVWYSAWTFDLPLTVKFVPNNPTDPAPDVEMDFTCTKGVYSDSILCSLFCPTATGSGIDFDMPHHPALDSKTEDGVFFYYLSMGEMYRDLLLKMGIDYNVQVFVKVTYKAGGNISLVPDDTFANCMDGHKFMHLGDTVRVNANDGERHVIVPYVQWKNDSIRYVWNGTEPCEVVVAGVCDFEPMDYLNERIIQREHLAAVDTAKVTSRDLSDWVDFEQNQAGMYYAKFYTTGTGVMKIERVPMDPPQGGATLLKYDKETKLAANDMEALYAIPYTWTEATKFVTPTDHVFKMYVGTSYDFTSENAIATYRFNKNNDGHWLGLSGDDMQALWAQTNDKYLYIRFECTAKTTILPTEWVDMSDCMTKAQLISPPSTTINVQKGSYGAAYYRFYYNDWKGGAMKFKWGTTESTCPTYIGVNCSIPASATSGNVIENKTIPKTGARTWTIPAEDVAYWEEDVDPDGYLYIRFNPDASGSMTISTTAPEEQDPPCAPYDSVLTVAAWDSYIWRGTQYVSSGEYTVEGAVNPETECIDTLYTLQLTIHHTYRVTYEETDCDSIVYNGESYTQSGEYLDTIYDAMGNRSIVTLQLTVNHPTTSDTTAYVCGPFEWHGMLCEQAGEYTDTLVNAAQCDSIVTLHLAILEPTTVTLPDTTVCAELGWDGYLLVDTIITTPGTYTRITQTVGGCDSIVTQTVDVKEETYYTDYVTAYDSCVWIDGKTYRKSGGGPVYHMPNAAGCDSVISLYLTIKHLHKDTVRHSVCPSELPYVWYGKSCEGAGLHTADAIVANEVDTLRTLDLTVLQTSASDTTATACDAFTWYGKTYTESGNPTRTLSNAAGCDSVITLNLTIRYSTSSEEYRSEYMSYSWNGETYRYDGTYFYHTTNVAGCDSVAILHLTLQHDTVVEWFCPKSGIVEHVDTLSNPRINYIAYRYEKPSVDLYMNGVVSGETAAGAYVDLARVQTNLAAYYVEPLTPVESISWRYAPFGGQNETLEAGTGAQWINAGTISMDMIFHCGYRYYGSFTVGKMTEKSDIVPVAEQPMKRIENGQVVIIRNGKKYNMVGLEIGE